MPHSAASDLGLHCLPMSQKWDARLIWVKYTSRPSFDAKHGNNWCSTFYDPIRGEVKFIMTPLWMLWFCWSSYTKYHKFVSDTLYKNGCMKNTESKHKAYLIKVKSADCEIYVKVKLRCWEFGDHPLMITCTKYHYFILNILWTQKVNIWLTLLITDGNANAYANSNTHPNAYSKLGLQWRGYSISLSSHMKRH